MSRRVFITVLKSPLRGDPLIHPLLKRDAWSLPLSSDDLHTELTVESLQNIQKLRGSMVVPEGELNEREMDTTIYRRLRGPTNRSPAIYGWSGPQLRPMTASDGALYSL